MTEEQLNEIKEALIGTVKITVNGKIDKLQEQVIAINEKVEKQEEFHKQLQGFLELKNAGLTLQQIGKWLKDMGIYFFIGWEIFKASK